MMPKILVAEDNIPNRKLALAMLGRLGYGADAVVNGRQALEAVQASRYDAVLMDCRMPEMDGFTATAEIRAREEPGTHLPIIAMTADAMEGDRQRCLDAGMDDYLSKPVSFETLGEILQRWVPRPDGTVESAPHIADPAPVRSADEPTLDPVIIAGLRRFEKERGKDWMPGLIRSFLADADSSIEQLRAAIARGDAQTIIERSHALAGSASTLGARELGARALRLKKLASENRIEGSGESLAGIESELGRVRAALGEEFPATEEREG